MWLFFLRQLNVHKAKEPPLDGSFLFVFLLLGVRAAHALVALAGMAVAVRAHVDGLQLADVLRAVMAAGCHGAMNGLVHKFSLRRC